MFYKIELLRDKTIMFITIFEEFRVREHQPLSDAEAAKILDETPEPIFHIVDLSQFRPNMDDVLAAANQGARSSTGVWHHPNNKALIFVSPHPLVKFAANGLASSVFGGLKAQVFATVTEAFAWVEAQMSPVQTL